MFSFQSFEDAEAQIYLSVRPSSYPHKDQMTFVNTVRFRLARQQEKGRFHTIRSTRFY